MKKISFLFTGLLIGIATIAQPVVDNAIIPVSVNLNSILRLNVSSGGNIEFTVNNIDQYNNGIANTDRYNTKFTVASSIDFNVLMYAESANLLGSDNTAHTLPTDNVGYKIESTGIATVADAYDLVGASTNPSAITPLNSTATSKIIEGKVGGAAGNVEKNAFTVHWELATPDLISVNTTKKTLLQQSISPDRYTTNVFLVLEPH